MKKVILTICCLSMGILVVNAQESMPARPLQAVPPRQTPVPVPAAVPVPTTPPVAAPEKKDGGIFKFTETTHNFGEVPEGPIAECDFEFINIGKKPITITEAHGSCGCTVPEWPHEPILPIKRGLFHGKNKKTVIHVKYNTTGRQGPINKTITINSDGQPQPMVLTITGNVKPKPAEAPVTPPAQGK